MLHRQALLASSCSQLEAIMVAQTSQTSCTPEFHVSPPTPSHPGALPPSSAPPTFTSPAVGGQRRALLSEKDGEGSVGGSKGCMQLVRSHSEPGLGSSTDTGTPAKKKLHKKPPKTQQEIFICIFKLSPFYCSVVDGGSGGSKASMDTGETFPHGAQQCRMKHYRAQANVSD